MRVQPDFVPPPIRARAILELRRRHAKRYAKARSSLAEFWRETKPDMEWDWFNQLMCEELDKFLEDVVAGKQPRLMIIAPPRHGKSEGGSRRFPAYTFGRYPRLNIIATSYAADLASRMNRDVQRVMDEPGYQKIFPGARLNAKNVATLSGNPLRNSEIFEVVGVDGRPQGSYRAAGVGQGITGMGADIGIIDDPVKDAKEAGSAVQRNAVWEWYESTFYSRLSPKSGIVIIMTRWHDDDLAGRLLKKEKEGGDKWRVVRFPAIAEEPEEHRNEGDALHPRRYPIERLLQIKQVIGEYAFGALYQGRPTPKGGGIVKREDFRFYRRADIAKEVWDFQALSVDAAFKGNEESSYVVIQAWGRRRALNYLLRQHRERMTFSQTIKAIKAMRGDFAQANVTLIEDKANGPAIIDVLREKIPGIIAEEPSGSKEARAEAAAPLIQAGNVLLPHPDEEPWVEEFIHEWLSVPNGMYWDQVDASDQYLNKYGRYYTIDMAEAAEIGQSIMGRDDAPWNMAR